MSIKPIDMPEQLSLDCSVASCRDNFLPRDGELRYWGVVFSFDDASMWMQRLMNEVEWKPDEANIYGKHIITRRQYAWFSDRRETYTYSGVTRHSQCWIPLINVLRQQVEQYTGEEYQSCLLNLYPDGETGMAWHSDDETELVKHGSIASLSFGASRRFVLKHRTTQEKVEMLLNHGDLLEMRGATQSYWVHSIPKTKAVTEPRINLTFRQMQR